VKEVELIDICFLIKSSLLALTAAYTKFRKMMWSMIWSCATGHVPRCVLLPHRHAGRLHWGKAESIQRCDFRMGRVTTGAEAQLCLSFQRCVHRHHSCWTAEVRPSQRVNKEPHSAGCCTDWRNHLIVRWYDSALGSNSTWLDSTRLDSTHSTCRAHAFWLCRASRRAQLDSLDTSSSTGSTRRARQALLAT